MPKVSNQIKRKRRKQKTDESYPARNLKRPKNKHKKDHRENHQTEEQKERCIFHNSTVDSIASNLTASRLLSSGLSHKSQSTCSNYTGMDPVEDVAAEPYYPAYHEPKVESIDGEIPSQLTPTTGSLLNAETEYIDIDDFLSDSAIDLESASSCERIKEDPEMIDMTGEGKEMN
jgi:hypothetical protein